MRNREILKESLQFPIKKYKHFTIVTLLFLFMEVFEQYLLHRTFNETTMTVIFIISSILPLVILGINLQIIFHILHKNRGLPSISFRKSVKEAVKDTILETYYYILTIIISIILTIPTGIYHNIHDIYLYIEEAIMEMEGINLIEIIGIIPDILLNNYTTSITVSTLIFIAIFTLLFSFCTLSKIDLEINDNYKQTFNIIYITKIVKRIGLIKYFGFIFLIIITSIIISNIVYYLNYTPILGSIISAVLEAFSLFFFLHSFAQLYPD